MFPNLPKQDINIRILYVRQLPLGRWILFVAPLTPRIKVWLKTGITLACPFVFFIRSAS
jgi:hypothetical protein